MALRTRITERLGIQHPVVQGGMMNVGYAELASAGNAAGYWSPHIHNLGDMGQTPTVNDVIACL